MILYCRDDFQILTQGSAFMTRLRAKLWSRGTNQIIIQQFLHDIRHGIQESASKRGMLRLEADGFSTTNPYKSCLNPLVFACDTIPFYHVSKFYLQILESRNPGCTNKFSNSDSWFVYTLPRIVNERWGKFAQDKAASSSKYPCMKRLCIEMGTL